MLVKRCETDAPFPVLRREASAPSGARNLFNGNRSRWRLVESTGHRAGFGEVPMLRLACLLLVLSGAAFGEEAIRQEGGASLYGASRHGAATASGEKLDNTKKTAASPDLPLGSHATVTNQD